MDTQRTDRDAMLGPSLGFRHDAEKEIRNLFLLEIAGVCVLLKWTKVSERRHGFGGELLVVQGGKSLSAYAIA